jgi:hypothetical protein
VRRPQLLLHSAAGAAPAWLTQRFQGLFFATNFTAHENLVTNSKSLSLPVSSTLAVRPNRTKKTEFLNT